MKPFNDYANVQVTQEKAEVPVGGYVCAITNAEECKTQSGKAYIRVELDIAEGEHKYIFTNDYNAQTGDFKKWRCVYNLWLPDGGQYDDSAKRTLKGFMTALAESNKGFANPEWDERKWISQRGKPVYIGFIFRNEEWEYTSKDGSYFTGWSARPFKAVSVDTIRNNRFTMPKDKPLKNKLGASPVSGVNNAADTFSLPQMNNGVADDFEEIIGDQVIPF